MAIKTRLGLSGTPGRPYAAWQAKIPPIPLVLAGTYRWVQMYFRRAASMYARRSDQLYHRRTEIPE